MLYVSAVSHIIADTLPLRCGKNAFFAFFRHDFESCHICQAVHNALKNKA